MADDASRAVTRSRRRIAPGRHVGEALLAPMRARCSPFRAKKTTRTHTAALGSVAGAGEAVKGLMGRRQRIGARAPAAA
jgi:hypothetical protein